MILAGCASTGAPTANTANSEPAFDPSRPLYVKVMDPTLQFPERAFAVAEQFFYSFRDGLKEAGYPGEVVYLDDFDDVPSGGQMLELRLDRWEVRPTGAVEAGIFARYQPGPDAEPRSLGMATGMVSGVRPMTTLFDHWDAFDDAAARAAEDLYRRLVRS